MRAIDADRFEVVTFEGKSDEFVEGAQYILKKIDEAPTITITASVEHRPEKKKMPVLAALIGTAIMLAAANIVWEWIEFKCYGCLIPNKADKFVYMMMGICIFRDFRRGE